MATVPIVNYSISMVLLTLNCYTSMANAQTSFSPLSSPGGDTPSVEITSHIDDQQVPIGELVIEGRSSDTYETNCQVYADVNDVTPMRNVIASGPTGTSDDFSKWTFTYSDKYQLIAEGVNELTAKISCFDTNSGPVSDWHTVNLTGVSTLTGSTIVPPFSFSMPSPSDFNTRYEETEEEDDDDDDDSSGSDSEDDTDG